MNSDSPKPSPAAERNPFRFSTKFTDQASGLVYYGYRYYHPDWGRWISSDPIGEIGGVNLNGMLGNNPVNSVDMLGLYGEVPYPHEECKTTIGF